MERAGHGSADRHRNRLGREIAAAEIRIAGLADDRSRVFAASQASNADDEHDPEGATIAYERELLTSLLAVAHGDREELLAARERVAGGSYGSCETCAAEISEQRLVARPQARRCITCSR